MPHAVYLGHDGVLEQIPSGGGIVLSDHPMEDNHRTRRMLIVRNASQKLCWVNNSLC